MAYKIVYGQEPVFTPPKKASLLRLQILTVLFILLFSLTLKHFWPQGADKLRVYLIPSDLSVTEEAFLDLTHQLRCGEPLKDSLETFCIQILEHDELTKH